MRSWFIALFFSYCSFMYAGESFHQALYFMHIGETEKAFETYQKVAKETGKQDFEVLRHLAMILVKEGSEKTDKEEVILSMFGAGISSSSFAMDILEKGLTFPDPEVQSVALHFIAKMEDEKTDHLLSNVAMASPFLSTRLEACYYMAEKRHSHAVGHTEALMHRLPPMLKPIFPQFFALMGSKEAIAILRKLLDDPDVFVRVQSILSIVQFHRDDLLPLIRKKVLHSSLSEQEALALALSYLKDSDSIPYLEKLADSQTDHVRLAAYKALYHLGDQSMKQKIAVMALSHNLFAIRALADIDGSEDILYELLTVKNSHVQVNSALALLQKRDPRALGVLTDLLIQDERSLAILPYTSPGASHQAVRVVGGSKQRDKESEALESISLALKENYLREAMNLGEDRFLSLAKSIFASQEKSLIPLVIHLLINLRTDKAIELLKQESERVGAPFIRNYANLALFKLKAEGPYKNRVVRWMKKSCHDEKIRIRDPIPIQERSDISNYSLSLKEKSQLLLDCFAALAESQEESSLELLVDLLKRSPTANRYALSGILVRASE